MKILKACLLFVALVIMVGGCSNSTTGNNGVEIPTQDEYLAAIVGCNFFFDANFLMERDENLITLTVPATGSSIESDLQIDNTFSFQVQDTEGNTADCVGEFVLGDDLDFECVHGGETCNCSYSRNDDN